MAGTVVDIVNRALVFLGQQRVMSLDDSNHAELINSLFDTVRREVLSDGQWSSATTRVSLAPSVEAPAFGFSQKFPLPSDFLRLCRIEDYDGEWKIEDGHILANATELHLVYVKDVENVGAMDDKLREAIAMKLAYAVSRATNASEAMMELSLKAYAMALSDAKYNDAVQDQTEIFAGSNWLSARLGYPSGQSFYRKIKHVS